MRYILLLIVVVMMMLTGCAGSWQACKDKPIECTFETVQGAIIQSAAR